MKKLAQKVLVTLKAIVNKEISLEEASKYQDVIFILNVVAIECCGVPKKSEYPLIDLINKSSKMPTLQEVEHIISKLFKVEAHKVYDLLALVNYQLLVYQKTGDIKELICLLKYYDKQEKDAMIQMAFLEVFKKIACVDPVFILGKIKSFPIGWQVEIKLATILTLIESKCPLFYFFFDQDLDRRGIDFVICDVNVQIKFEDARGASRRNIVVWNIPSYLITHKDIVEWLEKETGQSIYNRLPFKICQLIDKVLRY